MKQKKTSVNDVPLYLFHQGRNAKAYEFLGSHRAGKNEVVFRVWAPHAAAVSVVGDFNEWDPEASPMKRLSDNAVWECKIKGIKQYMKTITTKINKNRYINFFEVVEEAA